MEQRNDLLYNSQKEFIDKLSSTWHGTTIKNYVFENVDDLTKPMKLTLGDCNGGLCGRRNWKFLIKPILYRSLGKKSFKSSQRFYPVDFGAH
jgi:hypothetical protein